MVKGAAVGPSGVTMVFMVAPRTLGSVSFQLPHRSFWRRELEVRARPLTVQDYLVEQANLRGFMGAWGAAAACSRVDPALVPEEIIVGLCAPHATAEARIFKLVLRILQSGQLDERRLAWLARRERADFVLHWFMALVPEGERNEAFLRVARRFRDPPRGYRPLDYRYDPARLKYRPLRMEAGWPTRPR